MTIKDKTESNLIYFITFFSYSGYYAGLAIIMSLGLGDYSRLYSVPIRLLLSVLMLYIIIRNTNSFYRNTKKHILVIFVLFWLFYFSKVMLAIDMYPIRQNWYEYILYSISYCVVPFIMYAFIDFDKHKDKILNAFIHSGFIMAVTCLYVYRDLLTLGLGRISEIKYIDSDYELISPLALSYVGSLTVVLCFYKLFFSKQLLSKKLRWFLIINMVVSFYIFFLGSSRGSLISILACIFLFFLFTHGKKRMKYIYSVILLIPFVIWGIIESGSSIMIRTSNTFETGDLGRTRLWTDSWNEFIANPIVGGRIEIGFYPHNFVLETLMATGLIGFLLLLIILFELIRKGYKNSYINNEYLFPFVILLQGIILHSFSGAIYAGILLFLPLGIIFSFYNSK